MLDENDFLKSILDGDWHIDYVHPDDIPNIDLYMDQVTTFMDARLKGTKRYQDDKILTKTMINNYAKNHLLPPPEKKKYSREHILVLIYVYYLKNILSIKDISTLLGPLNDACFAKEEGRNLQKVYEEICRMQKDRKDALHENVLHMYEDAKGTFQDAPEEEREFLQFFSMLCNLSFDVYVKKQLIERLIDEIPKPESPKKKESKEKK